MALDWKVTGDKLVITVDLSKKAQDEAQPSKSGKSRVLGSTNGNVQVAHGIFAGVNVYKKI